MTDDKPVILVDADACPVKDEIYKVAERLSVDVVLVANSWMRIPREPFIRMEVVSDGFDAADDRIAELAGPRSVIVTADILLAERVLAKGAAAVSPKGVPFTANSIGSQVAVRAIMADLRAGVGTDTVGGPAPFTRADRSRFLQTLDVTVRRVAKSGSA